MAKVVYRVIYKHGYFESENFFSAFKYAFKTALNGLIFKLKNK